LLAVSWLLAAPWLAILGVIAALASRVRVEIVREVDAKYETKAQGPDQKNVA
jgi:hypothetical protein